ncbi:undecaprenyl-diphosphatase [Kitasatospora gansuensis]|uniref:Undecaprenyl-diphosphatase n=1 Tax=Kitasatospora gansuensis TaxID=258050 RepID=A0A7W7S9Z9_9ACTN|nr:phosphatase PAP2 family protein [Kitasatospora gansuensis]MBB4946639.1 undecaprenyl-diphosphatase [Kitasatospora gansuensis]
MDSEPHFLPTASAAPAGAAAAENRSTDRPAHTPRGARNGDLPSRPGALPPAPGRLSHARKHAWLPLLLLAALLLISWQVAVDGPLLELDELTRSTVHTVRRALGSTLLNHLGAGLSDLGGPVPAMPVLLLAGAVAAWREHRAGRARWWYPVPVAVLAGVLVPLLIVPSKTWFARPGPFGFPLSPEQLGWYPSGHTATSAIAYGTAALLLGRTLGRTARERLYGLTALVCLGVGAGLVWSDYHWLLDVLASWCLAGVLLWGLRLLLTRLTRR